MARHRNYRNYAYEDDMSDDVYGHSVEDYDMAVSPTTAEQFMFRRSNSRDPNLSAYMTDRFGPVDEEDEEESEEETLASSQDYRRPQLDPISEAKLSSCLDQLHSILGENLHEPTAVTAVIQNNFDVERALDQIFSEGGKQDLKRSLEPPKAEGSVSCKTQLLTKLKHGESLQYEKDATKQLSSIDNNKLNLTGTQLSKPPVTRSLASVSDTSPENTSAQSGSSLSSQSRTSSLLGLLQASPQKTLLSAPLSSLTQSGGSLSGEVSTSQPVDLLQISSLHTLMSAPLSSLSELGGSLPGQLAKSQPLDLLQTSSQSTLMSASLSSLSPSGGSSSQSTSQSLDLLQASFQNTLMSGPLSSLSQSAGSSGQSGTSLDLLQASSQNTLMSAPLSSLAQLGASFGQSATSRPLNLLQASSQNTLLSAPLSSLSQSGGSPSGQSVASQSLGQLPALSQSSLLSVPLSRLSGQTGSNPHTAPFSPPLGSLSQLSCQQGTSLAGTSPATAESPLLSVPLSSLSSPASSQTVSSSPLLSTPLSTLSQTLPATDSQQATYQDPHFSMSLSSLSQSGNFLPSLSLARSQNAQTEDSLPVIQDAGTDVTADVKCLAEKLENVQIIGSSSKICTVEKHYSQKHKAEHPSATPITSSTVNSCVISKEMKSGHTSDKNQVSSVDRKRQMTSRWKDIPPLTATPSLFGLTLCYSSSGKKSSNKTVVQKVVNELHSLDCLRVTAFDFSTPSPDDIVKERQKGAFSRKK